MSVTVKRNATTQAIVTPYQNSPTFGYIQVISSELTTEGGWMRTKSKSALIRGEVKHLEQFVADNMKSDKLPGRIVVMEFYESELPDEYKKRLDSKKTYDDAIDQYVKRAGDNGPDLTFNGERIIRFQDYYAAPPQTLVDIKCAYDNKAEVDAWRAANKKAVPTT